MTKTIPVTLLAASLTLLGGCGLWESNPIYGDKGLVRDRGQDYEKAEGAARLTLPPGMRAKTTQDQLVVPEVGTTASVRRGDFEVPRPEFFYVDTGSDRVNMRRIEGDRIIVVDEPIADVWLKLQEFWTYNGIDLAVSDPRKGVMETDWINLEGDSYGFVDSWIKRLTLQDIKGDTRNKLRVSVRPDPNDYARTSISMQHVQFPLAQQVSSIDWETEGTNVEYKSDMMFEMLRYLSKASQPTTQSLVALQQQHEERSQLGRDSRGNPVLKMSVPIDQAWESLNGALDQAQIDVGTRDQKSGMIYLTYTTTTRFDDRERMGFFEWLNSDREDIQLNTDLLSGVLGGDEEGPDAISYSSGPSKAMTEDEAAQLAADLNDPNNAANRKGYKIWFAGKVIYVFGGGDKGVYNNDTGKYEHTGRYQLKMNRTRNGVFLSVLTDQGLEAPQIVAEEILWTVKEHLPTGNS